MTDIAGGLVTLEYAATGLHYQDVGSTSNPDNTARDADLVAYVQAATPVIEEIIGTALSVSKTVAFDGGRRSITIDDRIRSITSVIENGVTLDPATDYMFDSTENTLYRGAAPAPTRRFAIGKANIGVTYVAGYTTIPANVQLACRELVRFWIEQGNQANRPVFDSGISSSPAAPQGFAVPNRVIELLTPDRSLPGFA